MCGEGTGDFLFFSPLFSCVGYPTEKPKKETKRRRRNGIQKINHQIFITLKPTKKLLKKQTLSLSPHHIRTLFLRINVTNAPFLVTKLQIKVLPCVIAFVDSLVVDRIVGFEGLGAPEADADADTFPTASLETRLCAAGVLFDASASVSKQPHLLPQNDNGDDADTNRRRDSTGRNLRTGNKGGGGGGGRKNGSGAEDAEDDEWD